MFNLFYNGNISTLNQSQPFCSALLTCNSNIVFCGDLKDINLPDNKTNKINLHGKFVVPSFTDCHTHLLLTSAKYDLIQLDQCWSFEETLNEIRSNIKKYKKGSWIRGSGWDANIWAKVKPHKKHLDAISTEHPIALYSKDLHSMWLNSLAMKMCNIDTNSPGKYLGKILTNKSGELSGIITEDACRLVNEQADVLDANRTKANLNDFIDELLAAGITTVHTMESLEEFALLEQLELINQLKIRVCFHPPADSLEALVKAKIFSGFGNSRLRIGGLKYFVDGSLGSQTAEMLENYVELKHAGIEMLTESDLTDKITYAAKNGLSSTIHAIGDKAINKTLNALEKSSAVKSPVPLRNRIEHSQIIHESDISRYKNLDVIASIQPLHIADDIKISEKYLGNRADRAYPIKSLLNNGTKVIFGSDTPVADFNPFKGILAAITRKYKLNVDEPSWNPNQKITIEQAIAAYTKDAAFASVEESTKGTLEPGKLADFIVLSEDILNSNNQETALQRVKVLATILNGEIVYRDGEFFN